MGAAGAQRAPKARDRNGRVIPVVTMGAGGTPEERRRRDEGPAAGARFYNDRREL